MKCDKLTFLGDVFLDKQYKCDINLGSFIFNLEYPISNRGKPYPNKINLVQDKSFIKETFGGYPVAVCLANNHIMDYGEEAFIDTIGFLEKNNIKFFGAGNAGNNFNNPLLLDIGNYKISLAGYSCITTSAVFGDEVDSGSALLDIDKIICDLKVSEADFKIVQLHWGMEDIPFPRFQDVELAHRIIDSGADMIIGHHAHVVQSSETYKGKTIFYGLGNCIFPDIDIQSYFNGTKFTRRSVKKQRIVNKQSILIQLSADLNVDVQQLFFADGRLFRKAFSAPTFIPYSQFTFRLRHTLNNKFTMVKKFLESPKLPSGSQIKKFFWINS